MHTCELAWLVIESVTCNMPAITHLQGAVIAGIPCTVPFV